MVAELYGGAWADSESWARRCRRDGCVVCLSGHPFGIIGELDHVWVATDHEVAVAGYATTASVEATRSASPGGPAWPHCCSGADPTGLHLAPLGGNASRLERLFEVRAVTDEPGGGAKPPGHGPPGIGRAVGCFGHAQPSREGELVRGVAHGVLDHPGDQFRPLGTVEAVGVGEQAELAGAVRCRRKVVAGCDVVVVELGVEPGNLGDLVEAVDGAGELPVDEPDGQPLAGDDVPRAEVAVSVDGVGD